MDILPVVDVGCSVPFPCPHKGPQAAHSHPGCYLSPAARQGIRSGVPSKALLASTCRCCHFAVTSVPYLGFLKTLAVSLKYIPRNEDRNFVYRDQLSEVSHSLQPNQVRRLWVSFPRTCSMAHPHSPLTNCLPK